MDKNCKTFHMHFPRARSENFRYNLPAGEGMNVCQIFLVLSLTNLNGELETRGSIGTFWDLEAQMAAA